MRVLHEELLLLETVRRWQLDGDLTKEIDAMRTEIERAGQGTLDEIVRVDALSLRRRNRALLARIGQRIGGKAKLVIVD